MNLGQITREKREFMLKAGDLRQEVKKLKEAIEEQRVCLLNFFFMNKYSRFADPIFRKTH